MNVATKTPPLGAAGLNDSAFPGGNTNSPYRDPAPSSSGKCPAAEEKIGLLADDIGCNVGALIATLNAVLAMRDCGDTVGLIYGLRRSKVYWRAITASAAELVAADAERLSVLRQGGGDQ